MKNIKLSTQLITGKNFLCKKAFKEVENDYIKPLGGLWSSTYRPNEKYPSEWVEWCSLESFCLERLKFGLTFEFKKNIKTFKIDNGNDLTILKKKIGLFAIHKSLNFLKNLNYEQACKYFDVIYLTSKGQIETRYLELPNFYGWDCESCFILNFDCIDLESVRQITFDI
jgi:hypothetical protein